MQLSNFNSSIEKYGKIKDNIKKLKKKKEEEEDGGDVEDDGVLVYKDASGEEEGLFD